jgi:hypothetical protein
MTALAWQIAKAQAITCRPRPDGERDGVRGRIHRQAKAPAPPSPALRATSPRRGEETMTALASQLANAQAITCRPRPREERDGVRGQILSPAKPPATPSPALRATSPRRGVPHRFGDVAGE